MEVSVSLIKADIGSIGGHTEPSREVLDTVRQRAERAVGDLLLDQRVFCCGDDISILMTHRRPAGDEAIHRLAWDAFRAGTEVAQRQGLYGAGQDLLEDAFSGNIRGLGPQVAEIRMQERPNEALMILAADKTEPGAFNLPLYLAFADPMYSPGLLLSEALHDGFRFRIMDVEHTEGDRVIDLDAPERLYDIAALLRDTHRLIAFIHSRRYPDEQAASVSTTRLRQIAGRYVGKDDPVAVLRVQKIFPATEEFGPPFAIGPFVAGDTRGSHNLPLLPVPVNTPASSFFCHPIVCALGLSVRDGRITGSVDLFADPVWEPIRHRITQKAADMRRQGFFQPAMLPHSELEYGGIVARLQRLEEEFRTS